MFIKFAEAAFELDLGELVYGNGDAVMLSNDVVDDPFGPDGEEATIALPIPELPVCNRAPWLFIMVDGI